MPCSECKARNLLKTNKAVIYKRNPFTIKLTWECEENTQPCSLGIDVGSKIASMSVTTSVKELLSCNIVLRNDIMELISSRAANRRSRRYRKTRNRQIRVLNRIHTKKKGWLPPSVKHKLTTHIQMVERIGKLLPISSIRIECAIFDVKNELIDENYFNTVREYVINRDGYKCCGKSGCKNKDFEVHHIETRKTGGNSPNNLITLCKECHNNYHTGVLKLKHKRQKSYKHESFMSMIRHQLVENIKTKYNDVEVVYGNQTSKIRTSLGLSKQHYNDAFCISGNLNAIRTSHYFIFRKVRRHNRMLHKHTISPNGTRKLNKCEYKIFNFRLFDKVIYNNLPYYITSRRTRGAFIIKDIFWGNKKDLTCKKLKFVESACGYVLGHEPKI